MTRSRLVLIVLTLCVALVPAIMAAALLRQYNQATLFDLIPAQSDEIMFWRQSATFAEVGFAGGYYTAYELTPRVGGFYAWGLAAPVFYGSIGAVFGWPLWAIAVINLVALAAAVVVYAWLIRASLEQMAWLGVFLALYHPLNNYAPTGYIEVLNMALALVLAGGFVRLLRAWRDGQPVPRGAALITGTVLLYAALLRAPWAVLFLPLLLLIDRPATWRRTLWTAAKSVAVALIPVALYALTSAPYPETILSRIARNPSLDRLVRITGRNIARNMALFMDGDHLELHVRVAAAVITLALTAVVLYVGWRWVRRRGIPTRWQLPVAEASLAWFTLATLLAFIIVVYDIHGLRGYRMLAGALLMAFGVTLAFRRRWLIVSAVALLAVALPYSTHFYDLNTNFQTAPEKHARYAEYKPLLADALVYDPSLPSRWCNTVLFDLYYLLGETSVMVSAPPGFGTSITEAVPEGQMPIPPESRYLGLRDTTYALYADQLNVEAVLPLPEGMLYRNLDADCSAQ
ncbi:MAG: hypothetical protein IT298_11340 [Chloroflexi bacterium]|nr:hypothetical protein [Chloroflexota bacterium]